jgi:hypothetical protein
MRVGGEYQNGLLTRFLINAAVYKYGKTPLIGINSDGEPSRYAECPDNWIFFL